MCADCWPLARVRIYTDEPQALQSALRVLAQHSPLGKHAPAAIAGKPGVAANSMGRAAVLISSQTQSSGRHGATYAGRKVLLEHDCSHYHNRCNLPVRPAA